MALITFSGYPSSGKSRRANELMEFLKVKLACPSTPPALARSKLVVLNDEALGISKSAYDDSKAEKPARATLFSAVQRSINLETIVIVDAMNYIKGARYQFYCAARETQIRMCTVHIATPPDKCEEWNRLRPETASYSQPTIENLLTRFEEPSSTARWDSPLITIPWADQDLSLVTPSTLDGAVEGEMIGGQDAEAIWLAITQLVLKPQNTATIITATSSTSYLTMLESTTSLVIATLLALQALSPGPISSTFTVPTSPSPTILSLELNKTVTMPLLQRIKRQYVKLNMQAAGQEMDPCTIARVFGDYLVSAVR